MAEPHTEHALRSTFTDLGDRNWYESLVHQLGMYGFAPFEGIRSREHFEEVAGSLGPLVVGNSSELSCTGTENIRQEPAPDGPYTSNATSHRESALHTDGATLAIPPKLMAVYNEGASPVLSSILSGRWLLDTLRAQDPGLLKRLSNPEPTTFDEPGQASYTGPAFSVNTDGLYSVRFRTDVADFPGSSLSAIMRSLEGRVSLGKREGYVIDNTSMLHGFSSLARTVRAHVAHSPEHPTGATVPTGFLPLS